MAKPISLQYLAGFFDGEGCITSEKKKRGRRVPTLRINVFQKYPEVLKEFKRRFGGQIREAGKGQRVGHGFRWYAATVKAYYTLHALLPFLHVKSKQAIVGMKLASRSMANARHKPISSKEVNLRERLAWRLKRLKRL